MTSMWYYQVMGEEVGPVSAKELRTRAVAGIVTPDTFVRQAADENWHVAQSVAGLFTKPSAPTGTTASDDNPRVQKPTPIATRQTAQKLCGRIRDAMSGIQNEVEDDELKGRQLAQICEALRRIASELEELEGSL